MRYSTVLALLVLLIHLSSCCDSKDYCNNHGVCNNEECKCDALYFGSNCTYWANEIGKPYEYWFYPYMVINLAFFVASIVKFYQLAKVTGFSRLRKDFSVRHLSVLMLVLGLFGTILHNTYYNITARVINTVLLADGNWQRTSQSILPIFFFVFFPFVIMAYTCELLIWMELYTTTTLHNIERLPRYRKILLIMNLLVFPVELALRIVNAIYRTGPVVLACNFIWASFIGFIVLTESIGFLILSILLIRKVKNMKSVTGQEQQKAAFMKLSGTLIAQTVMVMLVSLVLAGAISSFNSRPYLFLAVNIVARLVEFGGVIFIMIVVKPQERGRVTLTTSHSSGNHPMTDLESLRRTLSNDSSISNAGKRSEEETTPKNFVDLSTSSEMVTDL